MWLPEAVEDRPLLWPGRDISAGKGAVTLAQAS